ncbi:MAG: D-tyrosyl-tRNA(Tyr) deacylase [Opitutales bacterium]|jgi:D-tyrosyl-tRNA(Tyr) deacylase|nr:D-tyrosyl-tRNA(Tyr) deacylase [Opitutales bacterium]
MKMIVQRVRSASVAIDHKTISEIKKGYLLLVGIGVGDTTDDVQRLVSMVMKIRIFPDAEGKMQHSIAEVGGEILVVSQFTLLANFAKGNRPSFHDAAKPEAAQPLFEALVEGLRAQLGSKISTGVFGADMQVSLCNDGPVTIILE